jgi:Flp pilus assembly protein TadG
MHKRARQNGQELIELGIVVTLFILLVAGIMQFGHAFMVANMVTHAARDGARLAASWADRGVCQQLQNYQTPIETAVRNRIASVVGSSVASGLNVNISQLPSPSGTTPCATPGTTPTVTVNVTGCVGYLFNVFGFSSGGCTNGFHLDRSVTFDDELRTGAAA